MDDKTRALLGDREAAKRLTDAGVLVPCPFCGGEGVLDSEFPAGTGCGMQTEAFETEPKASLAWNTRALILSAAEMELLEKEAQP